MGSEIFTATPDDIGASSFTLNAGAIPTGLTIGSNPLRIDYPMMRENLLSRIQMLPQSSMQSGPGGSIQMGGPYIDIGGALNATSGSIALSAKNRLTLQGGAEIRAEGYNKFVGTVAVKGMPVEATPLPGGTVSLTAGADLVLFPGSVVSVSGSLPIHKTVVREDWTVSSISDAGKPGTIQLSALGLIQLDGNLKGQAYLEGTAGGTLSITRTDPGGSFTISAQDLARFREGGFDALSLASAGELNLRGSGQISLGRSLTLNAPKISVTGSDSISLGAPWVQVTNSFLPSPSSASLGSASLSLGRHVAGYHRRYPFFRS